MRNVCVCRPMSKLFQRNKVILPNDRGENMRDEPLRMSAWKAKQFAQFGFLVS